MAQAFTYWTSLDDRSFRVLCRMALVSLDNGNPPKYFAGRDDLAAALGKSLPAKPEDTDFTPEAEAARKVRASVYEIVRKAVAKLVKEGVIVSSGDARFRNRAEYSLHLTPQRQPQQNVAPAPNESLPQQTQQIVAPMPQQNVAPMPQRSVATDPTERCPLGVEEPLKEPLIGIQLGSNITEAFESPTASEPLQGEILIDLPEVKAPTSKAALAKQLAEDFNDWYAVYPKHTARKLAEDAYVKARKNGATAEELLAGARRFAAERKGQDPKFTAGPAPWLNQERWTDDPTHTGEIDVEAVLGKDYWTPGTPPEGLSVAEEIAWKKQQRAERNAERLEEAKAKQATQLGPWDPGYHTSPNVPPQYAWANRPDKPSVGDKMRNTFAIGLALQERIDGRHKPDHGDRALAKGMSLMAAHEARQEAAQNTQDGPAAEFGQWFSTYPRHEGLADAQRAYTEARKAATAEELLAGAQRYAADPNREPGYTKLPAKWLASGGWNDSPLPPRRTGTSEDRMRANLQVLDGWSPGPNVDVFEQKAIGQ
ncbi:hypothetical protein J1902_16795 [Arthrobacter sp. PO-11]|uniref:Uncharacterized protein n=1 Tax=Arthrobacter cavernae TaxID=2817681 RepID=A0A939HGP5_9MICC|nr:hypothetical protein [Arthrobacter cavernae]